MIPGQLLLDVASAPRDRRRPGRPRSKTSSIPHLRRPDHSKAHPVHVTWRVQKGLPSLRARRPFRAVMRSIAAARELHGGRIVQFSVQGNHMHFIVEADARKALFVSLRALGIRLARAINRAFGRRGRALSDRYHARALRTPLEVKHALRYVLMNRRHHEHGPLAVGVLDGCSSAPWFDGWSSADVAERSLVVPRDGPLRAKGEMPVAKARTWLLRIGWKRRGLLEPSEVPARRN